MNSHERRLLAFAAGSVLACAPAAHTQTARPDTVAERQKIESLSKARGAMARGGVNAMPGMIFWSGAYVTPLIRDAHGAVVQEGKPYGMGGGAAREKAVYGSEPIRITVSNDGSMAYDDNRTLTTTSLRHKQIASKCLTLL